MAEKSKIFRIKSYNCRGLRDKNKRLSVFAWIKDSHQGISLIQESHSTLADELKWQGEWGSKIYFSHGEFNAKGVAILIPKNIEQNFKLNELYTDNDGRLILMKCEIENNHYTIINVYCPTKDNAKGQNIFLQNLKETIDNHSV